MSGAASAVGMARAGLVLQGVGAGSSLLGSVYSAQSQKSSLEFQADMAKINANIANINADTVEHIGQNNADLALTVSGFNASIAELNAQSALEAGRQQITAQTMKVGQVKGAQRAALAANGVDLGEGSAAEVQESTDLIKEIDTHTIEANALGAAWGYRVQGTQANLQGLTNAFNAKTQAATQAMSLRAGATSSTIQAGMANASASVISPVTSGFTSLLTSAPSVADAWFTYADAKKAAGVK